MTKLFEILGTFFAGTTLIVYICIFLGKILEVTLWLIIAGNVLSNYQSDPWKMVAYALAYSLGNYAGSWLEERLAFGLCSIQCVVMEAETADKIGDALRAHGFGLSEMKVQGRDDTDRYMLMSTLRRKLAPEAMDIIGSVAPNAVITVSDVKSLRGGYMRQSAGRRSRKGK